MSIQEVCRKKFDQLQNVLSVAKIDFDLIGITETKQQVDKDFLVNVSITGYHMYTQPSKSNAGGVAIYINPSCTKGGWDDPLMVLKHNSV